MRNSQEEEAPPVEEEGDDRPTSEWWWEVSEEEREFWSGLSAAAARRTNDPERLYQFWREGARTETQQCYVRDLISRVERHLREGTGVRLRALGLPGPEGAAKDRDPSEAAEDADVVRDLEEAYQEMERDEGVPMDEALPRLRERLGIPPKSP